MSENKTVNRVFLKIFTGLFTLFLGFAILTPTASMQDAPPPPAPKVVVGNANVSAKYQPTPEPTTATVRGRIIYSETGRPLRRAGFILLPSNGRGGREISSVTNERGEFEIKNVREGRYFVSVSTPGVLSPFSSFSSIDEIRNPENAFAEVAKDFQEIVVASANDVDTTISIRRGAAITGRIVYADGESAAGVRVEILRKKNGKFSAVIPNFSEILGTLFGGAGGGMKTDDRGMFRVAALPAGEYVVRVIENAKHDEGNSSGRESEMPGLLGINPNSMLATYFPNTSDVNEAEIIKLELGQESPEIFITIPNRSIQNVGVVVLNKATRQPLKNMRVSLKSGEKVNSLFGNLPNFGADGSRTDEQGRVAFKELPSGKYSVVVHPPYSYESEEAKPNTPKPPKFAKTEKEFTIEDKDIESLVVEVSYGATISGTVSFEKNDDIPSPFVVSATDQEGKFSETDYAGNNYKDGKIVVGKSAEFKIEGLPSGKVFLDVILREYTSDGKAERKSYIKSILLNGKDVRYTPLEIKEGENIKGVQIILSKEIGKLKGKVTSADGKPVAGASISFVPTDKNKWVNYLAWIFASTNTNGEYEISGEPGDILQFLSTMKTSRKKKKIKTNPFLKHASLGSKRKRPAQKK